MGLYRKAAATDNPAERDAFLAKARELDIEPAGIDEWASETSDTLATFFGEDTARAEQPKASTWVPRTGFAVDMSESGRWEHEPADRWSWTVDGIIYDSSSAAFVAATKSDKRRRGALRRQADRAKAEALGLTLKEYRQRERDRLAEAWDAWEQRYGDRPVDIEAEERKNRRRASWRRYAAKIPKTPERRAAQAAYMREYRCRKAAAG